MEKKLRIPIAAILLIITSIFDYKLSFFISFFDLQIDRFHFSSMLRTSIILFWPFVIDLAICITLFIKKRSCSLLVVLGCAALLAFINVITAGAYGYYKIYDWLIFTAYGLLFVFAIAFCEQTFIKADMSKIKKIFSKFYFLPAIFYMAAVVIEWINVTIPNVLASHPTTIRSIIFHIINNPLQIRSIPCMRIIFDLLGVLILLSVTQWIKNPYKKQKCKICGRPIAYEMVSCPICSCESNPDASDTQDNDNGKYTKKIFHRLTISVLALAIGLILIFSDFGNITGIEIGICLKCWGTGVVKNAYGIMTTCTNCSGGQLAYQETSFGIIGLVGTLIAFVSGFSTIISWKLLKK